MLRKISAVIVAMLSSTVAHSEWQQGNSKHFVVYANDSPEKVKAFTTRLEKFDKAMKVLRGVPEDNRGPSARVNVYMVDSVADVQRLMPGGGRNVAGFYESRATGSAAFVPRQSGSGGTYDIDAQRVLLHEYGHHFMYSDWPSAIFPMWFSEGFAEFHSTALFKDDGSVIFGAPPLDRGYGVTMINQMPLSRMLKPNPGKMSDMETYALYSRGWLLTHYLTFDPDRRKILASYINDINSGKSVEEASKVFGNLDSLDFKLTSYVKRPRFQSITIPATDLKIDEVNVRALDPAEAAIMPALVRSNAGVSSAGAPQVAALARRLAAPFPNSAAAQNELAEAEYDAKNYTQSEAAADRAIRADPKSVHALLYKGMALQAVAEAAKSTDAAQWQTIRGWYIAGNKIAVEDPQPLILYYRSFDAAKQRPTKSAEAGLLYAYALAPFDLSVRMAAGKIFLQQGKIAEAREALQMVAFNPHGGAYSDHVRDTLATLDKEGAPAALASMDNYKDDADEANDKKKPKGG